jgi:cation diffusion facilitator CzcD-associated flavoprotein CzcO
MFRQRQSRADVIMVDRRHAPGGHWLEAYPFVRLHQPSAYYGVNSLPLVQTGASRLHRSSVGK